MLAREMCVMLQMLQRQLLNLVQSLAQNHPQGIVGAATAATATAAGAAMAITTKVAETILKPSLQ